ncbi:MAG TPA: hypothetical protein VF515_10430 [Candidatus Binatia bacterium]
MVTHDKQGNKVTPWFETLKVPETDNLYLDIGLWKELEMTIMIYYQHQPHQWRPPALPLEYWEKVLNSMSKLWSTYLCKSCTGGGPCSQCKETRWKDFSRWQQAGSRIGPDNRPIL